MSKSTEELKQKLGFAIAHGTYMDEEARESYFNEMMQLFGQELAKRVEEDDTTRLRELLAVIHGDGGHYTEEHGIEKSWDDAMQLLPYRTAKADLQGSLDAAKQILSVYRAPSRDGGKMFDFDNWLPSQIEDWEEKLTALTDRDDKKDAGFNNIGSVVGHPCPYFNDDCPLCSTLNNQTKEPR